MEEGLELKDCIGRREDAMWWVLSFGKKLIGCKMNLIGVDGYKNLHIKGTSDMGITFRSYHKNGSLDKSYDNIKGHVFELIEVNNFIVSQFRNRINRLKKPKNKMLLF